MTDGYWRIKQYAPNTKTGFTVTTITVAAASDPVVYGDEVGPTEPRVYDAHNNLVFRWPDGRQERYPWASIVHAEYQPPTNPQKEGT